MERYRKRHAEGAVEKLSTCSWQFSWQAPRQVGKTTMLQKLTGGMDYVSLDDYIVRIAAQEESGTFLKIILLLSLWTRFKKSRSCFPK